MTSHASFDAWIGKYERAWRMAGTETLRMLFTEGASYRMSPYEEPVRGLAAIAGSGSGSEPGQRRSSR